MKKDIILLLSIILVITIFSFYKVQAREENNWPLLGKTIYLDAGHGGRDPGAIYGLVLEKDITLVLTKKLALELGKYGAYVLMTREGDYDLSSLESTNKKRNDLAKRASLINEAKAHLYISIHLNAYSSVKWRGLQIFYDEINPKNSEVAEKINVVLKSNLSNVREIKRENGYYLYHKIRVPGVLIEAGFMTNDNDRYLLSTADYQDKLVRNITLGVINYFS